MKDRPANTWAETAGRGRDRYLTFLSLSGDGIARFELDPPLYAQDPEDEQLDHILRRGRVAECNELFAHLYGLEAGHLVGLAMGDLPPKDDPTRRQGIRAFIRSGYRIHAEEQHVRPDGSTLWLAGSALGEVEDGRLRGLWVCLRDITERKRAEADRESRGAILEAVAFSAARLLQPGSWRARVDEVLARLGRAADVARAWIAQVSTGPDGAARLLYRFAWGAPGIEARLDYPLLQGGLSLSEAGLGRLEAELRSGRAIAALVRQLPEVERTLPARAGSKAFATVPIFAAGQWWGLLAFSETRYEREWSAPEVEALKAAAAVLGAAIDREQADDALRESEERFERLSAATFEGIGITDAGAFVDGNEQLAAMLASPLADLVGRPVSDFVAPEDIDLVRAQIAAGSEGPYQHMALRADGSRFPVEVRARSLPHRGRTLRVTALRDISARVLAEERQRRLEADLRQAAEQWRQTFDALDLGLVLADPDGRIVRLNRGALDLATTSSFAEAAGRTLDRLSDQEPWRTVRDLHRRVGESRASVTAEALEAGSGRSFYILANPWFRAQGEPPWRLITFRDVTDFVRMQDQLRHARTMQAMGSLVAGVAHEVRNPLFSISAAVDALEAEMGQRPEFAEYAALLRSQVGRLSQLMRDLLDFGKPAVLRRSPTSLADLWRRAGRACAALARERKVRVEEHLAPELPPVDVDAARVEQAFENLLANAVQHAPAGSAVRVRADIDPDLPEPTLRCTVEDDGPGLPAGCETQIFEPFFTRRKGGTGLGLSIVQRVVEAHGGRVSAENREGGGARFRVLIPVDAPRKGDGGA